MIAFKTAAFFLLSAAAFVTQNARSQTSGIITSTYSIRQSRRAAPQAEIQVKNQASGTIPGDDCRERRLRRL